MLPILDHARIEARSALLSKHRIKYACGQGDHDKSSANHVHQTRS